MPFWTTVSSLATAGATLFLAVATFMSVRSANRSARAAELSTLARLRPLLLASDLSDTEQKVGFIDGKWVKVPGGGAVAEIGIDAIYLAMSVRNVASGIAVLHGWFFHADRALADDHPGPDAFRRLTRDLYVPASSPGFFQGALRDPNESCYGDAARVIAARQPFTIDVLYGDQEGGQRVITRFTVNPRADSGWIVSTSRHWNLDRPDPRGPGRGTATAPQASRRPV